MKVRLSSKTLKKLTAGSVAGVFFFTTVSEPLAQTNFWADRHSSRAAGSAAAVPDENQKLLRSISWSKDVLNPVLGAYRLPSSLGTVVETHGPAQPDAPVLLHLQHAH